MSGFGSEDGHHAAATFHLRVLLDLGDIFERRDDRRENFAAAFMMGVFTTTEHDAQFHLVFLFEKATRLLGLELDIVIARLRTHPNFLQLNLMALLILGRLLLLLVFEFAVVKNSANRRTLIGRDFHEIEARIESEALSIGRGHHAVHHTVLINHANLRNANLLVDTMGFAG